VRFDGGGGFNNSRRLAASRAAAKKQTPHLSEVKLQNTQGYLAKMNSILQVQPPVRSTPTNYFQQILLKLAMF
jgi:hypothetical protein